MNSNIKRYLLGKLEFGKINAINEGILVLEIFLALTFFIGNDFLKTEVPYLNIEMTLALFGCFIMICIITLIYSFIIALGKERIT